MSINPPLSTKERVHQLVIAIQMKYPFWGHLLLGVAILPDSTNTLPTIGTDGQQLLYNEKWLNALTNNEIVFALCHEIMHCALEHMIRRGKRNALIWNVATDAVVNNVLKVNHVGTFIQGGVTLPIANIAQLSAEEIYQQLCRQYPPSNGGAGRSRDGDGNDIDDYKWIDRHTLQPSDSPSKTPSGASPLTIDWKQKLSQATLIAKARGNTPAGLEEEITVTTSDKIPWQQLLQQYLQQLLQYDYTFNSPNRRMLYHGYYFPDHDQQPTYHLLIGIDTSGSISSNEILFFMGEIMSLLQNLTVEVTLCQCDAELSKVDHYTIFDTMPPKYTIHGRGGTSFVPVFNYYQTLENPQAITSIIYFTDGDGEYPCNPPENVPVMWVMTTKNVAPFGITIPYHLQEEH